MIHESEHQEYIGDDWLEEQDDRQRTVIVDPDTADALKNRYVCAGCWGNLETFYNASTRMSRVACLRCGDGRGFVTKHFVEQRRADNVGEAMDVRQMLQSARVVKYAKRTAEEVLSDLGF